MKEAAPVEDLRPNRLTWVCFLGILATTIILCVIWCKYRLFWVDELLEYYTDAKPTADAIISGQLHAPFSLEPPGLHLILHSLRFLHHPQLTARLPSIFGLCVTEACVFWIAFRRTQSNALSLAAMLLPFTLVTIDYAPEARAYSLLTACLALAILSWQRATERPAHRLPSLCTLAFALGLAVLLHFYGIFIAIPLWVGEIARSLQRRRLDRGVLTALFVGTSCLVLDIPFERALTPFRAHYYSTGETAWSNISFTYYWFQAHFDAYEPGISLDQNEDLTLILLVLLFSLTVSYLRKRAKTSPVWLEISLLTASLLPVINLVAAQVTKAYVPRYSLPAIVGLSVLAPLILFQYQFVREVQIAVLGLLFFFGVRYVFHQILFSQGKEQTTLSQLGDTSLIQESLRGQPDQHLYVQDVARLLVDRYYADPALKPKIVGFYSAPCELQWNHRDPGSLFAKNMAETANLPFVPFSTLRDAPGPKLLVIYHEPLEEWIEQELQSTGATITPLGKALGGDLVRVTLSPQSTCAP